MAKQPAKSRKTPAKSRSKKPDTGSTQKTNQSVESEDLITAEVDSDVVSTDAPKVDAELEALPEDLESPKGDQSEISEQIVSPEPVLESKPEGKGSAFFPMVLGGLVAGGLGYGAAYLTQPKIDPLLESKVATQAKTIADLQDSLASLPVIDPAQLDRAQADREGMSEQIADLDTRLSDLLKQPAGDGSLSAANIAAYQQELESLRASVEDLRGSAVAELEAARATAASIEENAEAAARAAAGRAALARVQGAIETGAPMGAALDDLADALQTELPAGLTAIRDGAPTLAMLQADFPDLARTALSAARSEGVSGEAEGGFTAFLRNQFSVRSTSPQEGNTVDAILSRAQAAVNTGRLADALSEIGALPEVARAPLSDWVRLAESRVDAQAAAATLTEQLNVN